MENAILIFIKNPVLSQVKTRLAKSIGEKKALDTYRILLEKTRQVVERVDAKRYLHYSDQIAWNDEWENEKFQKRLQPSGDLGERLITAAQEMGEGQKFLIIGSDCYDLRPEHLEEAFRQLDVVDLVLGPANDGGYYLIGMKKPELDFFKGISWSTSLVLEQTLAIANQKDYRHYLLEELIDLDTFDDLKASGFPREKIE